jgi:putative endonuclease
LNYISLRNLNKYTIPSKDGIQVDPVSIYYIYLLASKRNGTLYVGVTHDLIRRVYEHKNDFVKGFTSKYGVHRLVYFEQCEDYESAVQREKQIKEWKRKWKLELIEKVNPEWKDLYEEYVSPI